MIKTPQMSLDKEFFIDYLCDIEAWKTTCKNLHWSADNIMTHLYVDNFLLLLDLFQDSIAEDIQGIYGQFEIGDIVANFENGMYDNPIELLDDILIITHDFYIAIDTDFSLIGLKSELENFVHNVNKYKYLFNLCM